MLSEDRRKIEEHFGDRVCKFLEIGAYDGVTDSLTIGLVQKGWTGVVVEPNPNSLVALIRNMEEYPNITVVSAAIGDYSGLSTFWIETFGGQRSTLSADVMGFFRCSHAAQYAEKPLLLRQVTIDELLPAIGGPSQWNLLVIDAEGVSGKILRQFPLSEMHDTELVCVEIDISYEDTAAVLLPYYDCEQVGVNVFGRRKA